MVTDLQPGTPTRTEPSVAHAFSISKGVNSEALKRVRMDTWS